MLVKFLSYSYPLVLLSASLCSPAGESYTICLPQHLDLNESGSFIVEMQDSTLLDNETVYVEFDNTFTLSDAHGKPDISGNILNNEISFTNNDMSTKTINYTINDASVGSWSGNLDVNITLDRQIETNLLIDGTSINNILKQINPTIVTFSHDIIDGDYLYDLSLAQDESILLYQNGSEVIISNASNVPIKANEDMSNTFLRLNSITNINNLNYLDMSDCINMSRMFSFCTSVTSIDVSDFDTSKCKNMSYMFDCMHSCTSIGNITNWDVRNVEDFSHFLNDNKALKTFPADFSNWQVSNKCTNTSYMFCSVGYTPGKNGQSIWPANVDLSSWDTSNIEDMSYMFKNSFMMTTLNVSGWETSKVTNMSCMLEMIDSLEKSRLATIIGLQDFDVSNVTNMSSMFSGCRSLASANFTTWNPISVTSLNSTFKDCRNLDLSVFENWNIDKTKVDITNCFASNAGYYVDKTYKPSWSN